MTRYVNSGQTPPPIPKEDRVYRPRKTYNSDEFDWSFYLNRNETLEWSGRSTGALKLSGKEIAMSAFGLIFVFSGLIALSLGAFKAEPIALLVGAAHFGVGAYLAFGRHLYTAYKLRKTFYALTENRALIFEKNKLHSVSLHANSHLEIVHHKNCDSIFFDKSIEMMWKVNGRRQTRKLGFRSIANGREVYQKILKIIEDLK